MKQLVTCLIIAAAIMDRSQAMTYSEFKAAISAAPDGGTVTVEMRSGKNRKGKEGPIVAVKYPAAHSGGATGRLVEYEVTVENLMWGFTRIHTQKRVMAKGYCYADESVIKEDECLFLQDELPLNTPIRFKVTPLNSFGQGGSPILSANVTLPMKGK